MAVAESEVSTAPPSIRGFARFFRGYALSLSLIVATVPVLGGYFDLMPFFASTKAFVTGLTSLGSYLIVAFIFFQRSYLAALYFPLRKFENRRVAYAAELDRIRAFSFVPGVLIVLTVILFLIYTILMGWAVKSVAYQYGLAVPDKTPLVQVQASQAYQRLPAQLPFVSDEIHLILEKRDKSQSWDIQFPTQHVVKAIQQATPDVAQPYFVASAASFLLAFLCAVSAFVLMGLRDYLQAELKISDAELHSVILAERQRFYADELPGIYGVIEFSPVAHELPPVIEGPFCEWHDKEPEPAEVDADTGNVKAWRHRVTSDDKVTTIPCDFKTVIRRSDFDRLFRQAAENRIASSRPARQSRVRVSVPG